MKKNILLLLMALLFMQATAVQANEWFDEELCCHEDSCCTKARNFYAKILGGVNFLQNTAANGNKASYQTGYVVGASLGYSWRYGLRLEAEYAYRRNDIKKIDFFTEGSSHHGHFQVSSYMANLLWDLPLSFFGCTFRCIQPFVGAGIGYDFQKLHSSNSRVVFNQKWNRYSWQLITGLTCPILCNADASLEYKFHHGSCNFYHHTVAIGLTYKFGIRK